MVFLFTLKERRNVVLAPMGTASFFFFLWKKGKRYSGQRDGSSKNKE